MRVVCVPQTGMSTVCSYAAPVTLTVGSTRLSSPTKWASQPATHICMSQVSIISDVSVFTTTCIVLIDLFGNRYYS